MQITALLCADTLKGVKSGTGKAFTNTEQDFFLSISNKMGELFTENKKESTEGCDTELIILNFQSRLKKIDEERKEALQSSRKEEKVDKRTGEQDNEEDPESEGDKVEIVEEDGEQDQEISNVEEFEEEIEEDGDLYGEADEDDIEEEEKEEEEMEEGSEENNSEVKMLQKGLKTKKTKLIKLQAKLQKCQSVLEMRGSKASRLQQKLQKRRNAFQNSQTHLSAVMETFNQVKVCSSFSTFASY
eukprot:Gb_12537 [translate_table: standard]